MKQYAFIFSLAIALTWATAAHALTLDQVITKMNGYRAQNTTNPAVLGASAADGMTSEGYLSLPPEQSQVIVNDLRNTTGKPINPIVTKTVKYGMTNDADVKALQAFLAAKGFLDPALITGNFYQKTSDALRAFQVSRGITGTGLGTIVGEQTKWALGEAY
jgi:peptidoglycan hydrolase-like protein with peptidoglycan-binding domain